MPYRIIAIGDIHGCSTALASLIDVIDPQSGDTIVTLGDYVDRGPDSKGVLDQLISLAGRCRLVPILGNHDEMMLHAKDGKSDFKFWLSCGGRDALDSYGSTGQIDLIPREHFRFLASCVAFYETESHFFIHANYKPDVQLSRQDDATLRWLSLRDHVPAHHCSGKIAVVGHTPQADVLNLGHLICLDTNCCDGGWLTALDLSTGHIWQASNDGKLRAQVPDNDVG